MKKICFLICFAFLGAVFTSSAQGGDANYRRELKTYFNVSGADASFDLLIDQMFQMMGASSDKGRLDAARANIRTKAIDQLIDLMLPAYKKNISIDDLKEAIRFYQTPAGKRLAASQKYIVTEAMEIGTQWSASLQKMIQDELK